MSLRRLIRCMGSGIGGRVSEIPHPPMDEGKLMKHFRFSLKTQLLLFSIIILLIPWIGYKYVRGMESFLKTSLVDSLTTQSQAIATVLQQQPDLFETQTRIVDINSDNEHLYLRPLNSPMQLDGYTDDWRLDQDLFNDYNEQNIIHKSADHKPGSVHFSHASGSYKHYLYAIFKVSDDAIVYHNPGIADIEQSDHLRITLQTPSGEFKRYYLITSAPGRAGAVLMSNDRRLETPLRNEYLIQGSWQETAEGYTLEVRIPLTMIGKKLAFSINDYDDPGSSNSASLIGTSNTESFDEVASIMIPSTKLDLLLQKLSKNSSRIWVIDRNRRVLALSGNLTNVQKINNEGRSIPSIILSALYRLILQQPVAEFEDVLSGASKLKSREIDAALSGNPATSWRDTSKQNAAILTATYPIVIDGLITGAIMLEQNSNRILLLQNQAVEDLINLSIPVFIGATILIIVFAGRLTTRISHLRNQTEQAISADGRVENLFEASTSKDEIGDLSRSFADLLARLNQYNRYLETMASKLSHELRTPLTVVRSSLDNIEQLNKQDNDDTYIQRAREGVERLDNLLTRLSEASRLEQALQQTEKEDINLVKLFNGCIDGYRSAYTDNKFDLEASGTVINIHAAPDLIVQMLDKLISNAVDFSKQEDPIKITISTNNKHAQIQIRNLGPHLPAEMQDNLFDSMISVREQKKGSAHLGLGLYIVRLITEYHLGKVTAENMHDPDGVEFKITIPLC